VIQFRRSSTDLAVYGKKKLNCHWATRESLRYIPGKTYPFVWKSTDWRTWINMEVDVGVNYSDPDRVNKIRDKMVTFIIWARFLFTSNNI